MNKHSLSRLIALLTLPLLSSSLLATGAGAQQASPGITDNSISIGITSPVSGPAAALGAVARGIELRVNALNADGGVKMADGKTRKIDLTILDDAVEPQRALTNARRLVEFEQGVRPGRHHDDGEQPGGRALRRRAEGAEPVPLFGGRRVGQRKEAPVVGRAGDLVPGRGGRVRRISQEIQAECQDRRPLSQHRHGPGIPGRATRRARRHQHEDPQRPGDHQQRPDRRHPAEQSARLRRRHAVDRNGAAAGSPGGPLCGGKRLEADHPDVARLLLGRQSQAGRAGQCEGRAHGHVSEAVRPEQGRLRRRAQVLFGRLRQVQAALRQDRLSRHARISGRRRPDRRAAEDEGADPRRDDADGPKPRSPQHRPADAGDHADHQVRRRRLSDRDAADVPVRRPSLSAGRRSGLQRGQDADSGMILE